MTNDFILTPPATWLLSALLTGGIAWIAIAKASGWLIAGLPGIFSIVMSSLDADWPAPLCNGVVGNCILAVMIVVSLGGALLLRKVATTDV